MVVALVPAAGHGERFGSTTPKQFLPLNGVPVLIRTLQRLCQLPDIAAVVVAVPAAWLEFSRQLCQQYGFGSTVRLVIGGEERQDSVARALQTEEVSEAEFVVIHDAVRPFAPAELFQRVLQAARQHGAAVPGLPPTETVKETTPEGFVRQTLPRERLRLIQTPQAFRRELLQRAYDAALQHHLRATDDAALVEALGHPVAIIEGVPENLKITHPLDWALAELLAHIEEQR
ncbi:2-C-methyl-D-erythritol 4-phosphate cytidylyltransferase [bacterium HR21]|jgi:2-C-methyl-D-erythritol 4-phosphate cytidylyltransferase|nr:2-C-methyl-D-erythritol 4-phosphate cytidylyltransferase [bacterium HR21]